MAMLEAEDWKSMKFKENYPQLQWAELSAILDELFYRIEQLE